MRKILRRLFLVMMNFFVGRVVQELRGKNIDFAVFFQTMRNCTRVYLANAVISRIQEYNRKCVKFYVDYF